MPRQPSELKNILCGLTLLGLSGLADAAEPPRITEQSSGVEARLQAVSVWDEKTVWASGLEGTVLKSTDGGGHWESVAIPGAETSDFSDLQVLSDTTVLLMAVGSGEDSRIYKTSDGGAAWQVVCTNTEEEAYFNSFAFWDEKTGLLMSDGFDGKLYLLKTEDAGESWRRIGEKTLPPLKEGEFGLSASGTSVATAGSSHVWVATAGVAARVFASDDAGRSWKVYETPIASGGRNTGILSLAFRDKEHGVAVGGDLGAQDDMGSIAWTGDGGRTWTLGESEGGLLFTTCVEHLGSGRYLAVGRAGITYSDNDGRHWHGLNPAPFNAIDYDPASGVGWLVGRGGHIARFEAD